MRRRPAASGFTLVELLVATALTMVVTAGAFAVLAPSQGLFTLQPEVADTLQRLRVAASTLTGELMAAGAGAAAQDAGAVSDYYAAVRPYRIGDVASDARAGVHYRGDTLSVAYAAHVPTPSSRAVAIGRHVLQIVTRTYYLRADRRAGTSQLMLYDGRETDLPVLDDVVGLGFEYWGESHPPVVVGAGVAVRASYGPTPPPPGHDDAGDTWGAGENCVFVLQDGEPVSRMTTLSPARGLVPLASSLLTDGPWCPDAAHEERFDADLLRIRRVRVWLRVQAGRSFRGRIGVLFTHAGTATGATRLVPDQEIRFDVSPPNLNRAW